MYKEGMSNNEIAKHCWEADHNFSWDPQKVVGKESWLILKKVNETIPSLKNPNDINKFPTCFLKFGFLTYGTSELLIYFPYVDSN